MCLTSLSQDVFIYLSAFVIVPFFTSLFCVGCIKKQQDIILNLVSLRRAFMCGSM